MTRHALMNLSPEEAAAMLVRVNAEFTRRADAWLARLTPELDQNAHSTTRSRHDDREIEN